MIKVQQNDKIKDEMAKHSGYDIFRFWESDIKNMPEKVLMVL